MNFDDRPYEKMEENLSYTKQLDLWETAFGLQKTDGLTPSKYMLELALENARGNKSYEEIQQDLSSYYAQSKTKEFPRTQEADLVSLRIKELLSQNNFRLSPATLKGIHRHLFTGIQFDGFKLKAGEYRTDNISKSEPIIGGESVVYSNYSMIFDSIDYDFKEEEKNNLSDLSKQEQVNHITEFVSRLWQVHPFREGNTRTATIFLIQYLKSEGFEIDNTPFKENAQYFRDTLVLANAPRKVGQLKTNDYLEEFLQVVALGQKIYLSKEQLYNAQVEKIIPEQDKVLWSEKKGSMTFDQKVQYLKEVINNADASKKILGRLN
ncbi:MAG: Fic family protein [Streptococcaceae bacterium]|nr:Fic family protein [Streptococcaceae bacterium]MCL2681184.1 Fic family protein [Streptococcaceae bacterium]